jgi:hypothetical protein
MREPWPTEKLPRSSPLRQVSSVVGITLLILVVLAVILRLAWVLVPAGVVGLFVLGYFGVALERGWAKTICCLGFLGIVAFIGFFFWAVSNITF